MLEKIRQIGKGQVSKGQMGQLSCFDRPVPQSHSALVGFDRAMSQWE
jgi:hypothetical protein